MRTLDKAGRMTTFKELIPQMIVRSIIVNVYKALSTLCSAC